MLVEYTVELCRQMLNKSFFFTKIKVQILISKKISKKILEFLFTFKLILLRRDMKLWSEKKS